MADFKAGEYVDITIKGARISTRHSGPRLWLEIGGDDYHLPTDASVTVVRVAPAEWPPNAGDLWRDRDGDLWFVYGYKSGDGRNEMRLVPHSDKSHTGNWRPDRLLAERGPLTLLHREAGAL